MKRALFGFFSALLWLAIPTISQADDFPPGAAHDVVAQACTQCHGAEIVTSQHMTAEAWADTVKQMISNGAHLSTGDFSGVISYLAQHFGPISIPPGGVAATSPLSPPTYPQIIWRTAEGLPIDTRWPEKQDDAPEFPGQTRAPFHASPPYKVTIVTDKLVRPWALGFLPAGKMLVTERLGTMVIVDAHGNVSAPLAGVPPVVSEGGQGGLLDVVLDPHFVVNHRIFFSYDQPAGPQVGVDRGGAQSAIAIGRATLDEDAGALKDLKVIFVAKPAISIKLYPTKQGSRIAIGGDGNLYVTVGDRDSAQLPPWNVAQSLRSDLGKIIRITPDGEPANGNPFVDVTDALPEIWAIGTRSQEGLTFDSKGQLWEVEDGPRGGDELNIIDKGKNYGWPLVTHGIDYPGWEIGDGITQKNGMEAPRYYWDPTIAPSGVAFYRGGLFSGWNGNLLVGGLRGNILDRLTISADNKVISEEPLLTELHQRIRDVRVGPDGAVYVLTDTTMLLRITPR
jgi:glucose/arabinose dehydrogenase